MPLQVVVWSYNSTRWQKNNFWKKMQWQSGLSKQFESVLCIEDVCPGWPGWSSACTAWKGPGPWRARPACRCHISQGSATSCNPDSRQGTSLSGSMPTAVCCGQGRNVGIQWEYESEETTYCEDYWAEVFLTLSMFLLAYNRTHDPIVVMVPIMILYNYQYL